MVSKFSIKIILGSIGAAALFILGLFSGRGRNDGSRTADRIDSNINGLENGQSAIRDSINDSEKRADNIAKELDESATIIDHSGASIKRAADIVEELQKRTDSKNNLNGCD